MTTCFIEGKESLTLSIIGINVSHHNGAIDWHAAASSVSFAFAKATEGAQFIDPCFEENWNGMHEAHIPCGVYHSFDPAQDAIAQADHFLRVAPIEPNGLPPVLGCETLNCVAPRPTLNGIRSWLAHVTKMTGRIPILYTTPSFWLNLRSPMNPAGCPLWIAHHQVPSPRIPRAWNAWSFWQFTKAGRCRGISGYVDLSRFAGSEQDLLNLSNRLPFPVTLAA